MNFSQKLQTYINTHSLESQDELLKKIGELLPTGPSNIHWDSISNKIEIQSVQRDRLTMEVLAAASTIELEISEPIIIINIDDAFPAIRTTLEEWRTFAKELDYVNTIYIDENNSKIIHWDFYKNLYALKLPYYSTH
jgi:hypothetical protein